MDVPGLQTLIKLRLYGFWFGDLCRLQSLKRQHAEEVGVSAGVQLVGPVEGNAAIPEYEQPN